MNSIEKVMTRQFFTTKIKLILISLLIGAGWSGVSAQNVAVKTNLVSDALLSPNLGIEVGMAPRWTFDLSGSLNAWNIDNHKWKHWLVQPEVRYWFCDAIIGHFVGAHLLGGQYNFGNIDMGGLRFLGTDFGELKDSRHQGWYGGVGIAYGYSWVLGKHWNLEAELGVGWVYTRYDVYPCTTCGQRLNHNVVHNYVGPTKVAINLVYVF